MDDQLPPNPYKTLSVPKDATLATIRSAHRKLVLSCHPDKVQDESAKRVKAEQFHQVQQAYEILSDERRRQRYDEKVKLEELRAEMENEREPPLSRRTTDYDYPSPRTEMRGDRWHETREPQNSRYSDDAYHPTKYDIRSPTHKYADFYPASSGRRTSGRAAEEKKKAREVEDDRERRRREREAESFARDQRTKKRDKDKRRDTETKSKSKFSSYVDDESDSELEDRRYSSKRESTPKYKYEEPQRRSREEPRKGSKYDPRTYEDYHDELDMKLDMKISAQKEHINRSREAVESEPARRSGGSRATSNLDTRKPSPPPPASSDKRPSLRRQHGSRQPSPIRSSKRDRRPPEISIVDAPAGRKPSLPGASSDPKGTKGFFSSYSRKEPASSRGEPARAATYQPSADSKPPPMRRSETMPIDRMRPGNAVPFMSSNLKNMKAPSDYDDSSDSDSEIGEDMAMPLRPSPRQKSTSYRIHQEEDSFNLEPQEIFQSRPPREGSPKPRRSSDRPMAPRSSTTTRVPPMPRASSYAIPQGDRQPRPGLPRTESARLTPLKAHQSPRNERLYGEQPPTEENFQSRGSPKVHADHNVRYAKPYNRRGSEEVDRDAYPGSHFHSHRPRMGRNETAC